MTTGLLNGTVNDLVPCCPFSSSSEGWFPFHLCRVSVPRQSPQAHIPAVVGSEWIRFSLIKVMLASYCLTASPPASRSTQQERPEETQWAEGKRKAYRRASSITWHSLTTAAHTELHHSDRGTFASSSASAFAGRGHLPVQLEQEGWVHWDREGVQQTAVLQSLLSTTRSRKRRGHFLPVASKS